MRRMPGFPICFVSEIGKKMVKKHFHICRIWIIRLRDKADVPAAEDSLREHLEGRVRLYKTYEPEQMSRAESAVIKSDGSFVMLIMCDDPTAVENAFNEFLNTK